jgi:ribonuclease D
MIENASQLIELLSQIESSERVAIDTEADSLHCYREKLCLLQISVSANRTDSSGGEPGEDYVIDPLAGTDLAPLTSGLATKEIVVHGADFDLRLLRRTFDFRPQRIFDTVIAARLLGIKEFSLAALVQRQFGVELSKGSQKANWAQRPLPQRMVEYAINDTHYLLPMAGKFEDELSAAGRLDWFHQSCQRALEQAAIDRVRDADEAWRISGAGKLRGRAAAVLRELWQWRESEAEAVDRPPFHILQNQELIRSAERFASGNIADYRHFSARRRQAFREAAERALQLPEADWPVSLRRFGNRPSHEIVRRAEELKQRRDRITGELGLESAFVAPRSTLEAIAADPSSAEALLVPWQRQLLQLDL